MTAKHHISLAHAMHYATEAYDLVRPWCSRIEVAGSIRRRAGTVGDVELVVVPLATHDMLGSAVGDQLTEYLGAAISDGADGWAYRLAEDGGRAGFGPMNKLLLLDRFPIDIFTATPENWGMTMFIRTGPKEWNVRAMSRFQQLGMAGHAYGGVTRDGVEVTCPAEMDVFRLLGWEWTDPQMRTAVTAPFLAAPLPAGAPR